METRPTMKPLPSLPMPTHGVILGINTANSWAVDEPGDSAAGLHRLAYVATDATEPLAMVSAHGCACLGKLVMAGTRASRFDDMAHGLVLELYLRAPLEDGETLLLSLAQAGASIYYPPQPIDDRRSA